MTHVIRFHSTFYLQYNLRLTLRLLTMDYSQFYLPKPDPIFNSLPTETLFVIIDYLALQHEIEKVSRDLLALSRASRRLGEITTPFIFTHNVKNKGGCALGRPAWLQDRKAMEKLIRL